ncbi:hypothetical protein DSI35_21360 [Mycobacterium tuberculosis]|uniref:Uncharacterized protein n=5 Tax=Mycobacterium tuberculosis complex TaxID=77643 RepID=R4MF27_MYCTX|nr:hypothetical protein J113_07360 [Mycobacterium tuberculosis CAS/NITR204]AGL99538.1 hypothetical protein CFBS_1106 [Mycobacterium tuberculosis CCDC5079]AHJ41752.1 hypothetical protein HKBS1_1106 [Mycobacterium tuberculosis HKBS1]AHJ45906.1 hypothetical protein HKBT2_1109 [Mycobacterium tuberculosis BT2]AHJ50050.1 hypothetical protein HKBT1_1104 [Mycobacterium tuberculosis BT1]AHJ54192.1 hypothetical protein CFBR_1107 [Mycobacterium tuberculosis CCDC5180]AIB47641.1 hypothetical protein MTBK_
MTWCVREQLLTTATDGAQLSSIPSHPCLDFQTVRRRWGNLVFGRNVAPSLDNISSYVQGCGVRAGKAGGRVVAQ